MNVPVCWIGPSLMYSPHIDGDVRPLYEGNSIVIDDTASLSSDRKKQNIDGLLRPFSLLRYATRMHRTALK